MQKLTQLLNEIHRQSPQTTTQMLIHTVREYLQVLTLKVIYQSKYGPTISFMGGTCLRICYGLKRYSEDLDFALDRKNATYSFKHLIHKVQSELKNSGFDVETTIDEETTVQKSFIKFSNLLFPFRLTDHEGHKLQIKLEVDTKPIPLDDEQIESHFVTKFGEIFPIIKHKNPTLFAGKILAVLGRTYTKGRDYYDLIWFLTRKTEIDLKYLNNGIKHKTPFANANEIIENLREVVHKADLPAVLKDLGRFLEDPSEEVWVKNYQKLFEQVAKEYVATIHNQ